MLEIADEARGTRARQANGDWRFGTKGALILHANGNWFDFSAGKGGHSAFDLIEHLHGLDDDAATKWAKEWLERHPGDGPHAPATSPRGRDGQDEADDAKSLAAKAMAKALMALGLPVADTPAEAYLASRGIKLEPGDAAKLRWRPNARGPEGALIAAITLNDGELNAIQETYVTPQGGKSPIQPARRTYGRLRDGMTRLGAANGALHLCEGLEDALSARMAGAAYVGALCGIWRLGKVAAPPGVVRVVVVRDDDEPGSEADQALMRGVVRLMGRDVEVLITPRPSVIAPNAPPPLKDINDLLRFDPSLVPQLLAAAVSKPARLSDETTQAIIDEAFKLDAVALGRARAQIARLLDVKLGALDKALRERAGEGRDRRSQADRLIACTEAASLFRTPDSESYADVEIEGCRQTWPIRYRGFRRWLLRSYLEAHGGAPAGEAVKMALDQVDPKAQHKTIEQPVYVRVGGLNGALYLDLADDQWRAVEIDANGWRVVSAPPVRFRRSAGMRPLPIPLPGGSINKLQSFLNLQTERDFKLAIAFLLACLRHYGPYPVLPVAGESGSTKSTLSKVMRALIDPNVAPLRALPHDDRELFVAASNSHMLAFDNVSGLPRWLSDTLCRIASGGGFVVRQLYTDQDETLFAACRPILINGIADVAAQLDLAERAIPLLLAPIAEEKRRTEAEFWEEFNKVRPHILGALLDGASTGLRRLPEIASIRLPRMADFATWVTACETAFWPEGAFLTAYAENRNDASAVALEGDRVAMQARAFMATKDKWEGTASELLEALNAATSMPLDKFKDWPKSGQALAGRLRQTAPALRKVGIDIAFTRNKHARTITILFFSGPQSKDEIASSTLAVSSTESNSNDHNSLGYDEKNDASSGDDAARVMDDASLAGGRIGEADGTVTRVADDDTDENHSVIYNHLILSMNDANVAMTPIRPYSRVPEKIQNPERPLDKARADNSAEWKSANPVQFRNSAAEPQIVYCVDPDEAGRLIDAILADADGDPVAIDIETAPLKGEVARLKTLAEPRAGVAGRLAAARKLKDDPEAELKARLKRLDAEIAYAGTAALDPHRAQIRLLTLYGGGERVAVIDLDRAGQGVLRRLERLDIVAHNAGFELAFLETAGVKLGRAHCTMQMGRLTLGRLASLKDVAEECLGVDLSKDEQTGDWGAANLSNTQIEYAAMDAVVCRRVAMRAYPALGSQLSAYDIQRKALIAVERMERRGVLVDVAAHAALIEELRRERAGAAEEYARACLSAGRPDLAETVPATPKEKEALLEALLTSGELQAWARTEKSGALSTRRSEMRRAEHYPPIAALAALAKTDKLITAFDGGLAAFVSPATGRIHAHYSVAATTSGRASCAKPNLQQVPRLKRFRALIVPEPGNVLIVADYSSMELRAAAHIAADDAMTAVFAQELDPHRITAARMLGKAIEGVTGDERQSAKAVNFGSLYGMGAKSLVQYAWRNFGIAISEAEAAHQLTALQRTYPKLMRWRQAHYERCEARAAIVVGRDMANGNGRLYLKSHVPNGKSFFTRSCNLPVQGACADASMLALAAIDRMLFAQGIDGGPVLWLHDEFVLEVRAGQAGQAAKILKQAMIDAFVETFPGAPLNGLVEPRIVTNWGEAKG
jgi:DNA polymerase I-like protein with 3'-5' exonuclease and polymerase domains